jgi:2-keto-4-pentenoate hydratase/2-oxohepta-3-ene-1,7-dioic acid hydratase in catechol pathway
MRLASVDERAVYIDGDRVVDVADASDGRLGPDPMAVLEHWEQFTDWARGVELDSAAHVAEAVLRRAGPPVPGPRQVFALALNYRPHAAEVGFEPPEHPLVFTKYPSCLVGPCATVALPSEFVDWETELVVVIGRGGHRIAPDRAWAHVAGLTIGQDLTERRVQVAAKPPQFALSKSFPGFGPTGPVLVTPDEFPDPDDLGLTCLLGEEVVQRARTTEMIFPVPDVIARISAVCPLLPGDLIFTGTPAGVGATMTPERYLRPGDVLTSRIDGIGEIRTTFTADAAAVPVGERPVP